MLATRVKKQRDARRVRAVLAFPLSVSVFSLGGYRAADATPSSIEQCFLDLINGARSDAGVGSLT